MFYIVDQFDKYFNKMCAFVYDSVWFTVLVISITTVLCMIFGNMLTSILHFVMFGILMLMTGIHLTKDNNKIYDYRAAIRNMMPDQLDKYKQEGSDGALVTAFLSLAFQMISIKLAVFALLTVLTFPIHQKAFGIAIETAPVINNFFITTPITHS